MLHFSIHFYEKEDTLSTYVARDKTRINIIKTLLKKICGIRNTGQQHCVFSSSPAIKNIQPLIHTDETLIFKGV